MSDDRQVPGSAGEAAPMSAERKARLSVGEHVFWADGSVSVMGEDGLHPVDRTWRQT